MIDNVFKKLVDSNVFAKLRNHVLEQSPLDNHLSLVIKASVLRYLEVRIHFIMKKTSQSEERIAYQISFI